METRLDDIEDGGVNWRTVIGDFYPSFEKNLRKASSYGYERSDEICGKCGHFMLRRMGKFGKYLACSNYPECQNIISESKEEVSAVRCPKCGENMVVKSGKFGKFLACPSYPDCKSTMSMPTDEAPKLKGVCPDCKGILGGVFHSAACRNMSSDIFHVVVNVSALKPAVILGQDGSKVKELSKKD